MDVFAEPAAADDGDRLEEQQVVLAALLSADLEDAAGLLDCVADAEAFVDREGQRLFAVDVAARVQGGQRDRHVPVVGRADGDDVRFFSFQ